MNKRLGVIGIVIEDPKQNAGTVNAIISQYSEIIIGRLGIPQHDNNVGFIAMIVDGNTDAIGALTGKLGNLPGVAVKSALTAKTLENKTR